MEDRMECGNPIGELQTDDPLFDFLRDIVLRGVLGFKPGDSVFDVYRLDRHSGHGTVYRYTDRVTRGNLVCKFYGNKWLNNGRSQDSDHRAQLMAREFTNLEKIRALGFDSLPHMVVEPLAMRREINCVLVESYVPGHDLGYYIREACATGSEAPLNARLAQVSRFLADLHSRTFAAISCDEKDPIALLQTLSSDLYDHSLLTQDRYERFHRLAEGWNSLGILHRTRGVLLYGDARPTHFLFDNNGGTTGIDVETLCVGDRASDLGRLVAQIKHSFGLLTNDLWAGESFVQNVYRSYLSHMNRNVECLSELTLRGQFYMGCQLATIGLDERLPAEYRNRILHDAECCLSPREIGMNF